MPRLAVVPSLPVSFVSARQVRLTQKFVAGMTQYCALWPGAVVAVMHPDNGGATQNLDDRTFELDELPFEVRGVFDSRVTEEMIPDVPSVAARADFLKQGRPLSLAYSGRLSAMKGVGDLVEVAAQLRGRGIPFRMEIFGDGPLRRLLSEQIHRHDLGDTVFLRGVLEFSSELMPHMRDHVDLFVCCHPQGDPSCTYLETLSCGVPIIGYGNEALRGMMADRPMGWVTPLNDPGKLAARIADICADPTVLVAAARNALGFARQHTFPVEFKARIGQVNSLFRQ